MMRASLTVWCLVMIAVISATGISRTRQKEDPVQTLIKAAKFLEEKPLEKDAKDVRSWAVAWIIETSGDECIHGPVGREAY